MREKEKGLVVSNQISLLAEVINCKDQEAARLLLTRAFDVVNMNGDTFGFNNKLSNAEMDTIISLIREINPKDMVEMILVSQFVSTHLQGMHKLSQNETTHGMMLVRLSHQSLEMLQKHRNKGSNINVNYYVKNEGQAIMQMNIGQNLEKKGE